MKRGFSYVGILISLVILGTITLLVLSGRSTPESELRNSGSGVIDEANQAESLLESQQETLGEALEE